jgi:dihydroorotate dehydrogenase
VYRLIRPLLFLIDAEQSHRLILILLRILQRIPGALFLVKLVFRRRSSVLASTVMGLEFPNPVGLAAGLDKNAQCVPAFLALGFGSVELGTVTPVAQPGNSPKRLFRLPRQHALINRMGFPSVGVDQFLQNLRTDDKPGVIGVNIGKNKNTSNEHAIDDYLAAFRAVYSIADYVTLNISSPNTPQLRALQSGQALNDMLATLKHEQIMLGKTTRVYVPIALKIAPDLNAEDLDNIAALALEHKIDAIIATNTTIERTDVEHELLAQETGGLSGRPLKQRSTEVIRTLYNKLKGEIPIIGVGGIENADDAWEKMVAGADLIQVYTGLIYAGPGIVNQICRGLEKRVAAAGSDNLAEALQKARSGVHLMR